MKPTGYLLPADHGLITIEICFPLLTEILVGNQVRIQDNRQS